jgi:hypothetical protein
MEALKSVFVTKKSVKNDCDSSKIGSFDVEFLFYQNL